MRIGVYHSRVGFQAVGGIATFYRRMGLELGQEHDVTIYTGADEPLLPELTGSPVDVVRVDREQERSWLSWFGVDQVLPPDIFESLTFWLATVRRGVLRDIRTEDVVLTGQWIDDLLLSRSVETPLIYQYHGNLSSVGIGGRIHRRLRKSDRLLANSRTTAQRLQRDLGVDCDGIVYPGVDVELFSDDQRDTASAPQSRIVFVGRLHREKGVQDLLRSMLSLDADTTLEIVGTGTHREMFEQLAAELGIEDAVRFHGQVARQELPRYFQSGTVACHPSHHESFCMTNIEAMATGTPVVTTDLPAIREYAVDGENAILAPVGDPDTLADVLDRVLRDSQLRDNLVANGRETSLRFAWRRQAQLLENHCRRAANEAITA